MTQVHKSVALLPGLEATNTSYSPYAEAGRRRLPLSIRFQPRPGRDMLQIRITVDGVAGSGFSILPGNKILRTGGLVWDQKQKRVVGDSPEDALFNQAVDDVRTALTAVYDRQIKASVAVTPKTIQHEFQSGLEVGAPIAIQEEAPKIDSYTGTVLDCYTQYLAYLESQQGYRGAIAKTTMDKWRYGLVYLTQYVSANPKEKPQADKPAVLNPQVNKLAVSVNAFWAKQYHRWLTNEGPMAADSATRYVNRLSEAMSYAADSGYIDRNPIAALKLPRDKTKDVHFLEPEHLERFWALDLPGRTGVACWWIGIIFLTGMDYPDAVRYVENRFMYEQTKPWGKKIVITRNKPPRAECHIPVSPELEALLASQPKAKIPTNDQINEEMRAVRILIGFPHPLTCKVGRKTGGAIFFRRCKDINATSRMMGHSSVTITERYYIKTTGYQVDEVMRQESRAAIQDNQQSAFIRTA